MTNRERLVQKLKSKFWIKSGGDLYSIEGIADFIIADRKRICGPLVNALDLISEVTDVFEEHDIVMKGMYETLKGE